MVDIYKVYSKYAPGAKMARPSGNVGLYKKNPEYDHVDYQIKGNETYNNMLANALPLHTPLAPGLESKCHFFYSEVVMLPIK